MRLRWLACMLLLSCQQDAVILRVEGQPVMRTAFAAKLARALRSRGLSSEPPNDVRQRVSEAVLMEMAQDIAVQQRAAKLGIVVSPDEQQARMNEYIDNMGGPDAFARYLQQTHQTEEDIREQVQRDNLLRRVTNRMVGTVTVSEADIDKVMGETGEAEADDQEYGVYGPDRSNARRALMMRLRRDREEQADNAVRQHIKIDWAPGIDPRKL